MIQPPSGSARATAEDEVCRPRPVTAFTIPTARSASGTRVLTSVDLPTPDWPMSTLIRPASAARSGAICSPLSGRPVTRQVTPSGSYTSRISRGEARSALVRHSSGVMPAS